MAVQKNRTTYSKKRIRRNAQLLVRGPKLQSHLSARALRREWPAGRGGREHPAAHDCRHLPRLRADARATSSLRPRGLQARARCRLAFGPSRSPRQPCRALAPQDLLQAPLDVSEATAPLAHSASARVAPERQGSSPSAQRGRAATAGAARRRRAGNRVKKAKGSRLSFGLCNTYSSGMSHLSRINTRLCILCVHRHAP